MDVEEFRNAWWSSSEKDVSFQLEKWIEESRKNRSAYWKSLQALQNSLSLDAAKSLPGESYDFYSDLVLRHDGSTHATIIIDENDTADPWTYQKLHQAVNFQVKEWTKASVEKGQIAILLMPVGLHYWIALLTALRMGLIICFLPPNSRFLGKDHLISLIDEIEPNLVVTQKRYSHPLNNRYPTVFVDDPLELDAIEHEPLSHLYAHDQIMQISLSLHRQIPFALVPLDAHMTYLQALQDGLITLNLKPGAVCSSLHACSIRSEPCSTLAAFLSGATLLHTSHEGWTKEKIDVLELLPSQHQLEPKSIKALTKHLKGHYKSPLYSLAKNKIPETPFFYCLMDNSLGGAALISKPTTNDPDLYVRPNFGTEWSVTKFDGSLEMALEGFGLLHYHTSCPENNQVPSNIIVAQMENECLISSTKLPCCEGVTLPLSKIEASVLKLPFVTNCLLYTVKKMGRIAHEQLILLVFVDPMGDINLVPDHESFHFSPNAKDVCGRALEWTSLIHQKVKDDVGLAFLPDLIEYHPLIPKMRDELLDREWCLEQYRTGRLSRKRDAILYQTISCLKRLLKA